MVTRNGFCLILILFSLVETVTSQSGPLNIKSIVTVRNCEATFNFNQLNYKSLNFYSQQIRINITLLNGSDYVTTLPANKTINFKLKVDNGIEYTLTAESPEYCCNESITENIKDICFNVTLTCSTKTCPVSVWPDSKDFYKFLECKGCTCGYCYITHGNTTINGQPSLYPISLSIPMKNGSYQLNFTQRSIIRKTILLTIPHQDLLSKYQSPVLVSGHRYTGALPNPWDSIYDDFFKYTLSPGYLQFQLKKDKIPPPNGQFEFYLYDRLEDGHIVVHDHKFIWSSPSRCNVSYLARNFLNDPLLSVDCEKSVQLPFVISPFNDKFQMKDNLMYQKELTTYGSFNFSITANNETATKVKVSITLKGPYKDKPVVTMRNSEATFHFDQLNYTSLNLYNQQIGINITLLNGSDYVTTLPANKTINFKLKVDNGIEFTLTAKSPDPYKDKPVVTVRNCEATFHLDKLNYTSLNLYSQQIGINITLLNGSDYVTTLPANKTINFKLKVDNGIEFTLTAKSPEYCCNVSITNHYNYSCYTLKLKCQNSCYGIYPETPDFFTIPGSSKCSSIYCYRGGNGGTFQMSVPLPRNEHNYSVTVRNTKREFHPIPFLIGIHNDKRLVKPNYRIFQVWPQKYKSFVRYPYNGSDVIYLSPNKTFSPEGHFHLIIPLYIGPGPPHNLSNIHVMHFSVYAFKLIRCNIEKIDYDQEMWPLPMYSFNCTNSLNMELIFKFKVRIDKTSFMLSESKVYVKVLPRVNTTLFVGVSYPVFPSIQSVFQVNITVKQHFMSVQNVPVSSWSINQYVKVESMTHRPGNISDYVIHVPSGKVVRRYIDGLLNHTILEYYASVGRLYITNLTAVEDSKNRHVFTCHTKSTFTDLTYQWYWNENEITNDISSSMQNGKSQGRIILSGLNKNDSGNVTCHVTKTDFIPATRRRSISMNSFPEVKINASYHIIQNKKPVNVTCESVSNPGYSELIFEVNNKQIKEKKVTLSEEATVSCHGIYNGLTGEIKTLKILKAVGKKLCPAETYNNIKWPETVENTIANATCSEEFSGTISRLCSPDGIWNTPDNSNCLKKAISDAKSQLDRIALGVGKGFEAAVENLANATKQSIGAKDITETIDALKVVSTITNKSKEVTKKEVKNVIDIVDNLIKGDTKTAWKKLENKEPAAAASILKQMEDFGNVASQKVNETVSVSTDNLVIEYNKVSVEKNFNFPAENSSQPKWVEESESRIFIPATILQDKFGANETVSMNVVIFRNMKDRLPQPKNVRSDVNSYVLAISFGKKMGNLKENVLLGFTHLSSGYDEPSCNFWDFNINPEFGGYWSTRGCEVSSTNSTYTQCSCDHLTNFAILMNVVQHKDRKVLGIITKVGCSISIIALIFTIIIYAICWKSVTSQDVSKSQSTLLMNLCVSLIIAYLIFLTLVEGPREKNACTAIAALLHYFFLVVFFTMFAEGLDMAITLTVVFNQKFSRLPWLLVLCWVAPAIVVGISLATTKTRGFGNDVYCWLTPESNVIWSFIIPALIIILANVVCVILIVKSLLSAHCMLRESVKQRLRTGARAIAILTPLLGFTWIFGIFAINEETVVFEYIFTIASSLQGLFIFIAYCIFNKQIWKGLNLSTTKMTTEEPKQTSHSTPATKSTDLSYGGQTSSKTAESFSE